MQKKNISKKTALFVGSFSSCRWHKFMSFNLVSGAERERDNDKKTQVILINCDGISNEMKRWWKKMCTNFFPSRCFSCTEKTQKKSFSYLILPSSRPFRFFFELLDELLELLLSLLFQRINIFAYFFCFVFCVRENKLFFYRFIFIIFVLVQYFFY